MSGASTRLVPVARALKVFNAIYKRITAPLRDEHAGHHIHVEPGSTAILVAAILAVAAVLDEGADD